jgi:membrane protease subunit (stomatin/prohibitin family)
VVSVALVDFLAKQFISVIQWNEPEDGILAYRYPMRDMEIQNGGQLTVSESQVAAFVNEGRIADIFGPGLHTLNTRNLPILTDLKNWAKDFESPFKSEVYFFSTRLQIDQKWGTATPVTIRDREFGAVRLRCFGIYSYRIADPRVFFNQVSGTRDVYFSADLEGQLRDTVLANMVAILATSLRSRPKLPISSSRLLRNSVWSSRSSILRAFRCPTSSARCSISASAWAWLVT